MEKLEINLLGISCGHRKARNTAWLTLFALKAAEKACRRMGGLVDVNIELVDLGDPQKMIKSCIGCEEPCQPLRETGRCNIDDDYMARELLPKIIRADGLILGSPVFTGSYTSRFITLFERLRGIRSPAELANKPAGTVTTATLVMAGQENCLGYMDACIRALGMIPVNWMNGATGTSGPPYGPLPGDDNGSEIAAKKDRRGQWGAFYVGRRVAEVSVMQKIARKKLGSLYEREFIQAYHHERGSEGWKWRDLDGTDEKRMDALTGSDLKGLDEKIISQPALAASDGTRCKILGVSCDNVEGRDTSWLVIRSLKAIEKFSRRLEPSFGLETEFIELTAKKLRPCLSCDHRYEIPNGGKPWKGIERPEDFRCIIKNDFIAKEIMPRMAEADGFVFGSSVSALTPSSAYRILAERLVGSVWFAHTTSKPTTNISVSYTADGGQESCLSMMNVCNRWVELIPVSWLHGTPAVGGSDLAVKRDAQARFLSVYNARRVAEVAVMFHIAKRELGDIFRKEFLQPVHTPHGEAGWEWSRLDADDDRFMQDLTPKTLAELSQ